MPYRETKERRELAGELEIRDPPRRRYYHPPIWERILVSATLITFCCIGQYAAHFVWDSSIMQHATAWASIIPTFLYMSECVLTDQKYYDNPFFAKYLIRRIW
jgi:hypothetical protein